MRPTLREIALPLLSPCGATLLAIATIITLKLAPLRPGSFLDFGFYAVFGGSLLLALRFRNTRAFFSALLLAAAAKTPLMAAYPAAITPLLAIFIPVVLIAMTLWTDEGSAATAMLARTGVVLAAIVVVATASRISSLSRLLMRPISTTFPIPVMGQFGTLVFILALSILVVVYVLRRKPIDSGMVWAGIAAFMACWHGIRSQVGLAYLEAAGLMLFVALVEHAYRLAYHDELTGLPARRAFNEAIRHLDDRFAVAMVDVDHFKQFNDVFGHDTGDQVLKMVAAQLGRVTGGGRAFRCGGEEFAVLFPGATARDAFPHLEHLRKEIENSSFVLRGANRKKQSSDARGIKSVNSRLRREVSVTVSIGAAEPSLKTNHVQEVVKLADKALYAAKEGGRNRVEVANYVRVPKKPAPITVNAR